ncbi:hypothetical protein M422DRAFT_249585 [Sphaerobolus stellatus SS14]|uniref:Unplaced genomic scaffold SPHSTscaffold_30, whole genome shotgun sequence n=1 Tax=Sphaerobolus stellatus (strain SS14) TaxID=990650 RepID=A0A0C9VHR8_SPHS4|nr:hypothetical protein M422DRAFT_249585 [Sphaerobolus stellatus SS14]
MTGDLQPRPRGRPKKVYKPRGRHLALQKVKSLFGSSRSNISELTNSISNAITQPTDPDPPSVNIPPLSAEEKLIASINLSRPAVQRVLEQNKTDSASLPLFLDAVPRLGPIWHHLGTLPTTELPTWFDSQRNDYNMHKLLQTESTEVVWFGHPGDSPNDFRARRFIVRWREKSLLPLSDRAKHAVRGKVVLRAEYYCRGVCSLAGEQSSTDSDSSCPSSVSHLNENPSPRTIIVLGSVSGEEDADEQEKVSRWRKCQNRVKLVIEDRADDLGLAHIFQQHEHNEVNNVKELHWSRLLRNEVSASLRLIGAKPTQIMRELVARFTHPIRQKLFKKGSIEIPDRLPEFRRPTQQQIRQMIPAVTRRARLDSDPFTAVHILAQRLPKNVYDYNPHDFSKPDSQSNFTCALTTDFGLETLLLQGVADGVGADTSWRNKNENRAAVTFLTCVNDNGHLVPGSALLSANIKTTTLYTYFIETENRVLERAREIVKDPASIIHENERDHKNILKHASRAVQKNKWRILKWMIDKCRHLINAIKRFCAQAVIIICQFHIIQALIELRGDKERITGSPRIPDGLKFEYTSYFREAQRCRTKEDWPMYEARFFRRLEHVCMHGNVEDSMVEGSDQSDSDDNLPRSAQLPSPAKNWFTEFWLPHVTDIGLPSGRTRDGSFNTNNFSEAAFLVFDRVFLDHRKNKRIDRLALIIVLEWLPFYEFWPSEQRAIPQEIREANLVAHTIWELGLVAHLKDRIYRIQEPNSEGDEPDVYVVNLAIPRCTPCSVWEKTGKWCIHMRAVKIALGSGPVSAWHSIETENQRVRRHIPVQGARTARMISDEIVNQQVSKIISKLLQPDSTTKSPIKQLNKANANSDGSEGCWLLKGRRPARLQPLRKWRASKRQGHTVRFSKKSGRHSRARIGSNSLFRTGSVKGKHIRFGANNAKKAVLKIKIRVCFYSEARFSSAFNISSWSSTTEPSGPGGELPAVWVLSSDELVMYSMDCSRWGGAYMLRSEEVETWVSFLNAITDTLKLPFWFQVAGQSVQERHIAEILVQGIQDTPFAQRMRELFAERPFNTIIFLRLTGAHWTLWEYNIVLSTIMCTIYDSLHTSVMEIDHTFQDQIVQALHCQKFVGSIETVIKYNIQYTGLQNDGHACGFWAVFTALSRILNVDLGSLSVKELELEQIKYALAHAWCNFISGVEGFDGDAFNKLVSNLRLEGISRWSKETVALRPADKARVMSEYVLPYAEAFEEHFGAKQPPGTENAPSQHSGSVKGQYSDDAQMYEQQCLQLSKIDRPLMIGYHIIAVKDFNTIHSRVGWLSDTMIDAFLFLYFEDHHEAFSKVPSFYFIDSLTSRIMATRPASNPFGPYGRIYMYEYWIQADDNDTLKY